MQRSSGSVVTAGLTTIGVVAVAASSMLMPVPGVNAEATPASTAAVALTSLDDVVEAYQDLVSDTGDNLGDLAEQLIDQPAPALAQLVEDQLANLSLFAGSTAEAAQSLIQALAEVPSEIGDAVSELSSGDYQDAVEILASAVRTFLAVPVEFVGDVAPIATNTLENLVNVIGEVPEWTKDVGQAIVLPFAGLAVQGFDSAWDIYRGIRKLDVEKVVDAVLEAPAVLPDAYLNGTSVLLVFDIPGLLTQDCAVCVLGPGTIPGLLDLREDIADELDPVDTDASVVAETTADRVSDIDSSKALAAEPSLPAPADLGATDSVGTTRTGRAQAPDPLPGYGTDAAADDLGTSRAGNRQDPRSATVKSDSADVGQTPAGTSDDAGGDDA